MGGSGVVFELASHQLGSNADIKPKGITVRGKMTKGGGDLDCGGGGVG